MDMKRFAETYNKYFIESPRNVLEIGSRDGNDAEFLRNYFNISKNMVFVVEPNPISANQIKINHPEQKIFEFAISEEVGMLKFNAINVNNQMYVGMSSLLKRRKDTGYSQEELMRSWENWIEVKSITGKMLFDLIGEDIYDLVKIDVEGATLQVLRSLGDEIKKIKYLHLEAEQKPLWEGQFTYDVICQYMLEMDFIELYKQDFSILGQCDTVWCNKKMMNKDV